MKLVTKHKDGRVTVETVNTKPELTQQQFKDDVDITKVMKKYKTQPGFNKWFNSKPITGGGYTDLTKAKDYLGSLQTVVDAQNAFAALPSELRSRFNNDPAEMLNFIHDKKNYQECIKLGIFEKPKNQNQSPTKPNDLNEQNQPPTISKPNS